MSLTAKFEALPVSESSRRFDAEGRWIGSIELPDDAETWQNSIELPEEINAHSAAFTEKQEADLSRFEESRQIKQMAAYLNDTPEAKLENWINLSFDERVNLIQRIENQAAKVGCRSALSVETAPMGRENHGYMDWGAQRIVVNENLLHSNKLEDFRQCIKTLLHEGRHAFQYSNVTVERTEPNDEKYQAWALNLATGYCSAKQHGFKNYYLQPLEVDARTFSEAIVSRIKV